MGSYVEGALTPGEQVAYEGKTSIWSLLPLIVFGFIFIFVSGLGIIIFGISEGFILILSFGLGIIFCLVAVIRYMTTELAITNKRIIAKFGFISRTTIEINIHKAESIQVVQSILGRIFNFGSIVVSGAGTPKAPVPGISHPLEFRRAFLAAQEQATAGKA